MLTRSGKSVSSICSFNVTVDDSNLSSQEEIPSFDFQELLPYVCKKIKCEFDLLIKKNVTRDNSAHYKKHRDTAGKVKHTPKVLTTPSSVHQIKNVECSNAAVTTKNPNFITLTSLYDANTNLVEIFLHEQCVPRMLLKGITVIAPIYESFYKITIRNSKIDVYTAYELNKLLAVTNLTDICLDGSYLPEANYAILLEKASALKSLSLSRCFINDDVCKKIYSKLHYLGPAEKNLLTLNMSSNQITDEGAAYIGAMLRTNRRLRYLNLASNRIGDDGARHILDTLMEFPLTYDEISDKRRRILYYLKRKHDVTRKFMNECDMAASVEIIRSNSYSKTNNSHSNLRQRSKSKLLRIAKSKGLTKGAAENLAVELIGKIQDPFDFNNIVIKNGWSHCTGNLTLTYLNLSYNNLTYLSLKKVSTVLLYQSCYETGLFKIMLEGNYLPELCPEYEYISNFINKKLTVHVVKEAVHKKKSHSRNSSRGSTPNVQKK